MGHVAYALDSTTAELCPEVFWWAKFRKDKAAVKLHTVLDIKCEIPCFVHISDGKFHDVQNLEDTYAGMGDYQNAYPILKSLQAHKDSILNIDKQVAIHELELFYQAEQKKPEQQKAELLTISQENELIRQEFSSDNLQDSILAENGSRVISAAGNPLYWENLAIKFNLIFPGLVDRLMEKHPRLSPSDIQYCMLLKLNIPLRDIASILNITLQGVYKKKYRLEEKMGIDPSQDDINVLIQTLK